MSVPCNRCGRPLPKWELARQDRAQCPVCGAYSMVGVFPALFYRQTGPMAVEAAAEGEAACFDHPGKRAIAACGHCGRFVCQLCAVDFKSDFKSDFKGDFKNSVWCPSCFAAGDLSVKAAGLTNSLTLYDSISLTVALAPLLLWPFTAL